MWLLKLVRMHNQRGNLKSSGVPGEHPGNAVFDGQAALFAPKVKRRRKDKDVDKKKHPQNGKDPSRSPRDV